MLQYYKEAIEKGNTPEEAYLYAAQNIQTMAGNYSVKQDEWLQREWSGYQGTHLDLTGANFDEVTQQEMVINANAALFDFMESEMFQSLPEYF
jgi:hypothetical protein